MVVMNRGARSLATPVHETATGSFEKSAEGALYAAFVFAVVMVLTTFLYGRFARGTVHFVCRRMTATDALQRGRLAAASLGRFLIGHWETYENELKDVYRRKKNVLPGAQQLEEAVFAVFSEQHASLHGFSSAGEKMP